MISEELNEMPGGNGAWVDTEKAGGAGQNDLVLHNKVNYIDKPEVTDWLERQHYACSPVLHYHRC